MSLIDKHQQMIKLVKAGALIPGRYSGTPGNITYVPISIEEYLKLVESGDIQNLAYNTRTMGRGIFTIDESGKIINYKGVDSKLSIEDSIAVASTEGNIEYVNNEDSYMIMITNFVDRKHGQQFQRSEFRIKGASPLQDLVFEKAMVDYIERNDKRGAVKLPKFDIPVPLDAKMCEKYDLPRVVETTEDFLTSINPKSYAGFCLSHMKKNGTSFEERNETWREYFEQHHPEWTKNDSLMQVADKEDSKYQLGATFGQAQRVLENPFRIMEVQYYLKHNNVEALNAILDYTTKYKDNYFSDYAQIAGGNAAGFMNLKLAIENFEHRQDYPLSGEICDDAFDDVSSSLYVLRPTDEDRYKKLRFYSQAYVFATNLKVLEDAFLMTGRAVPKDYKRQFVETFYDSLNDKANFMQCFTDPNPMSNLKYIPNAEANFAGMESFMQEIFQIAQEINAEKNSRANSPKIKTILRILQFRKQKDDNEK